MLVAFSIVGIYALRADLDPYGGGLKTIQAYIALAIELCCLVFIANNLKHFRITGLTLFVSIWLFIIIILGILTSGYRIFKDLIYVSLWPITYITAFLLTRKDKSYLNRSKYIFIYIFIIAIFFFFIIVTQLRSLNPFSYISASNHIFYPLLLTPWILLINRSLFRNTLIIILFFSALVSFKRSAIIIVCIISLFYIFVGYLRKKSKYNVLKYFVASSMIVIFFYVFSIYNNYSEGYITDRLENIQNDEGSGRISIWKDIIEIQKESNLFEWIFGHGHFTVIDYYHYSAHNDFIEVLFNYGLIAFILYVLLYFILFKRFIHFRKKNNSIYISYGASLIIFITLSIVSHLIVYHTYFIYLAFYWGAIEAIAINETKVLTT